MPPWTPSGWTPSGPEAAKGLKAGPITTAFPEFPESPELPELPDVAVPEALASPVFPELALPEVAVVLFSLDEWALPVLPPVVVPLAVDSPLLPDVAVACWWLDAFPVLPEVALAPDPWPWWL